MPDFAPLFCIHGTDCRRGCAFLSAHSSHHCTNQQRGPSVPSYSREIQQFDRRSTVGSLENSLIAHTSVGVAIAYCSSTIMPLHSSHFLPHQEHNREQFVAHSAFIRDGNDGRRECCTQRMREFVQSFSFHYTITVSDGLVNVSSSCRYSRSIPSMPAYLVTRFSK